MGLTIYGGGEPSKTPRRHTLDQEHFGDITAKSVKPGMGKEPFDQVRVFIPASAFMAQDVAGGAGDPANDSLLTSGAGAPIYQNLNSSALIGVGLGADNDFMACMWAIPYDADLTADIVFHLLLHWAAASASGDIIDITMTYDLITPDSGTLVIPATTTGLVGTAAAGVNKDVIAWPGDEVVQKALSKWTLAGGTLGEANRSDLMSLGFKVADLDSGTGVGPAADEVSVIGLEIQYYRRHA